MKNNAVRRGFALMLSLLLLAAPAPAAFADINPELARAAEAAEAVDISGDVPPGETAENGEKNTVLVDIGSIYHGAEEIIFNNMGTVYNNGGTVYNNGGTVYNNSGLVYNNGGTVYNNGAEVYNNGGEVHNNGGIVHETGEIIEVSAAPTRFTVRPGADYSALAEISGAELNEDGDYIMEENSCLIFRPRGGLYIDQANTTTGSFATDTAGSALLERVRRDGEINLRFKAFAPEADRSAGAYSAPFSLTLSAGEGVEIHYSTDGSSPGADSPLYEGPVNIEKSCVVKFVATAEGADNSSIIELSYIFPELKAPVFERLEEGYEAPEALPLALRNPGLGTVVVESVKLIGEDAKAFVLSGRTESKVRVSSGQTDERSWLVAPAEGLEAGEYEAEAVFTYAGGDHARVKLRFVVED